MSRNEAAERLRGYLRRGKMHDGPYGPLVRTADVLDEALATERRLTVERIEREVYNGPEWTGAAIGVLLEHAVITPVSDEDAKRLRSIAQRITARLSLMAGDRLDSILDDLATADVRELESK